VAPGPDRHAARDLVACTVMDRIVPDLPARADEAEAEAERELLREASGCETVMTGQPAC